MGFLFTIDSILLGYYQQIGDWLVKKTKLGVPFFIWLCIFLHAGLLFYESIQPASPASAISPEERQSMRFMVVIIIGFEVIAISFFIFIKKQYQTMGEEGVMFKIIRLTLLASMISTLIILLIKSEIAPFISSFFNMSAYYFLGIDHNKPKKKKRKDSLLETS